MKLFKHLAAPALAVALLLGVAVPASAYFSAWDTASGGVTLSKPDTKIKEYYGDGEKQVFITNDEESVPVWVRARAYIPADLLDNKNGSASVGGTGWTATGGIMDWYTYDSVLQPGESTESLLVKIEFPFKSEDVASSTTEISDDPEAGESKITVTKADGTEYNIVVVYEYQPVVYEGTAPDATAVPATWNN